jgi:hypothetical protein
MNHKGFGPTLLIFPHDSGVWDGAKRTFTYEGKVIRIGETIEVGGRFIENLDYLKAYGKYDVPDCGINNFFRSFNQARPCTSSFSHEHPVCQPSILPLCRGRCLSANVCAPFDRLLLSHPDHCDKCLLRNAYAAIFAQPIFAFFLFVEQFAFAAGIATIAFGGDILAQRCDRFAWDRALQ